MPMHDWTRVDAGLYHSFHQRWISALCDALNGGILPEAFFALQEQSIPKPIPDVLTLRLGSEEDLGPKGTAVALAPPRTKIKQETEEDLYARRADRISVRHRHGKVIAIVEIVSLVNKASRVELRAFVEKAAEWLRQGVHLLIIDPFPPTRRDPCGIHKVLWDEFEERDFDFDPEKPLTLAAYSAGATRTAYVEPMGVGDELPDMPLFLDTDHYVSVPLEATYSIAWQVLPRPLKALLEPAPNQT